MSFIGYGTVFSREDDNTADLYIALSKGTEIGNIEETREVTSNIYFDSPGGYAEKVSGLFDAGELSLTIAYEKGATVADLLRADMADPDLKSYRIVWPDANSTTVTFDGLVSKVGIATPLKENVTQSFTIAISGKPVWT